MYISNSCSIQFSLPEEAELMKRFVQSNDLRNWIRTGTSQGMQFTQITRYSIGAHVDSDTNKVIFSAPNSDDD
jgi:hypothetical protein